MQRNIFAYTAPGADYPEYISVNEQDGKIEVTVRGPKKTSPTTPPFDDAGAVAVMTLPREEAIKLYQSLLRELLATDKA